MAVENEFHPQIAIHPGKMLQKEIEARQVSQAEFAERTGMSTKYLGDIIDGKADITLETANAMESETGIPASLWINLQAQYDEIALARGYEGQELLNEF